jgi:hypothetical protein
MRREEVEPRRVGADEAAAVFARAAELEAQVGATVGDERLFDEDTLLEIGAGAGLSPVAVRQALAELRTGAIERHAVVADSTWAGPRAVVVQRVVEVPVARARAAAERFLRTQLFEVQRQRPEHSTWRPREGWAAGARRSADRLFRHLDLDGVVAPVTLAVAEEPGTGGRRCLVRFEADLAPTRRSMGWGVAGAAAVTGALTGGVLGLAEPALIALGSLPAAGAAAGGVAVSRRAYRSRAETAATCFEAFLDRLEHGRA